GAELGDAAAVGMRGDEVERDVRVLDDGRAGQAALEVEERRGVREARHGTREADAQRTGRARVDAQSADPPGLLAAGALPGEEREAAVGREQQEPCTRGVDRDQPPA